MRHAVLGAGAVGGLVGTAIASLGDNVTMLVRPEKLTGYPSELSLERPSGPITAPAAPAAALTSPVDVLWIATKAYHLVNALEAVRAVPKYVVPLLNGVDHVQLLRTRFGHDVVLPATIAVEAEKIAPARFVQRSPFVNLNLTAQGESTLGKTASGLRDFGFTCRFVANEQTLLWGKLCFIGPYALVTTASGMNKGEIFADPEWKRRLNSAVGEACAVAKANGAEVEPGQIEGLMENLPAGIRSSMQKDLVAGRPLELDALGESILRGGKRSGVDVSTTAALVAEIRAKVSPTMA